MARNDGIVREKPVRGLMANTGGAAWFVIVVVLLFIVTCAGLSLFFNVGGIRDIAVALLFPSRTAGNMQPDEDARLQQRLKAIENEKKRLQDYEYQLNALKSQLEEKQQQLEQREAELEQKEREMEELQQKLSAQFEDVKDIAKVYENMEAEQAASILSEMKDSSLVIRILKNMPAEKSAEILGAMDSKKAADLTGQMAGQ